MTDIRPTIGDSRWFVHDRFGLFVHWGLYALGARHEWLKQRERLDDAAYGRYFEQFDPDLYDPGAWADAARDAGMRYAVITSKHHEGFCLWDSDLTHYKAPNTPAGRDLLSPFVDAFRSRDMRVGFYYSLIDWHHPDFVVDDLHPQRDHPDRDELNRTRDQKRYIEYLHGQVREILTRFGEVSVLWLDFTYPSRLRIPGLSAAGGQPEWIGKGPEDWDADRLLRTVRELQPGILVNNRSGLADDWDFQTPEQTQPRRWIEVDGRRVVWEACQTFSGSWGYHRDEASWKSVGQLVRMLVDTVSKGGNLLLNVGPTGRGDFDRRALERLRGIGRWMRLHSRSIYGCTEAPQEYVVPPDCRLTYNPSANRLYVHCFAWPFPGLYLEGLAGRVEYAQLLNDASELFVQERADAVTIRLPADQPDPDVPVVELFLR